MPTEPSMEFSMGTTPQSASSSSTAWKTRDGVEGYMLSPIVRAASSVNVPEGRKCYFL